jgi:hypothetical protein
LCNLDGHPSIAPNAKDNLNQLAAMIRNILGETIEARTHGL